MPIAAFAWMPCGRTPKPNVFVRQAEAFKFARRSHAPDRNGTLQQTVPVPSERRRPVFVCERVHCARKQAPPYFSWKISLFPSRSRFRCGGWPNSALHRRAEHVRSARVIQTSICSANARASARSLDNSFNGRRGADQGMTTSQYARLLSEWLNGQPARHEGARRGSTLPRPIACRPTNIARRSPKRFIGFWTTRPHGSPQSLCGRLRQAACPYPVPQRTIR